MAKKKKSKIQTPEWILKGEKPSEEKKKKKGKTFKVRKCPECGSDNVQVVVGEEAKGMWKCNNCEWRGTDIKKEELSEDEFMKYLDEKGEPTA